MVMDRDLSWGGEHTVLCTDDVWWSCALETYIILLTGVIPINSIKRKNKKIKNINEDTGNLSAIIQNNLTLKHREVTAKCTV